MNDFDPASDTRPRITGCLTALVETSVAVPCANDEITIERAICWRHGRIIGNERGEQIREPLYKEFCGGCNK